MLASFKIKSSSTNIHLTHDFSRLSDLVLRRASTTGILPYFNRIETKYVMEQHDKGESGANSNNRCDPGCCSFVLPPVQGAQEQNTRRFQESIPTATQRNVTAPPQYMGFYPVSSLVYHNLTCGPYCTQPVLHPYLSYGWFHRPEISNQPNQAATATQPKNMNRIRFWQPITTDRGRGFNFTVMSYNVLAQDLLDQHPYLYAEHKKKCLGWQYRWKNLMQELKTLKPDILCLQEVQSSHLELYCQFLERLGYKGIYKQRTGIRTDGCAIFYKTRLFHLKEYTSLEFKQPDCPMLDRDNVAILAKFSPKSHQDCEFLVATTHLLYNPRRQDVRLAQAQLLLTEVDRMAFKKNNGQQISYIPVIITGDLNSTPDSVVYQLIVRGNVTYENLTQKSLQNLDGGAKTGKNFLPRTMRITDQCQHADLLAKRKENVPLSRTEELELIELRHSERQSERKTDYKSFKDERLFSSGTLSHKFPLKSVYNHACDGAVEGTTFQDQWLSVDYIFYSTKKLTLLERYRLPNEHELADVRIPNDFLGSDHLCLIAKFKLDVQ